MDAIKYDRLDIAEYLLTHGADPNKLSTVFCLTSPTVLKRMVQ